MKLSLLHNCVGSPVFIYGSEIEDDVPVKMIIETSPKAMRDKLAGEAILAGIAPKLIHGISSSAISIPATMDKDLTAFIVIPYANNMGDSYIIEADDLPFIENFISTIVKPQTTHPVDDDILDAIYNIDIQNIEDLYILYGYNIPMGMTFTPLNIRIPKLRTGKSLFTTIAKYQGC
jgi:hypothetical protein